MAGTKLVHQAKNPVAVAEPPDEYPWQERNWCNKEKKHSRGSLKLNISTKMQIKQEIEYDFEEQFVCYKLSPKVQTNDLKVFLSACKSQFLKILQLQRDAYGCIWINLKIEGNKNEHFIPFYIGTHASFSEFIVFCFEEIEKCTRRTMQAINSLEIFAHTSDYNKAT